MDSILSYFVDRINRIYWIISSWLSACPPCEQGEAGGEESQETQSPAAKKLKLKTIKYLSFPQPLRLNLKNNL
jgi:hypothetical protein